MTLSYERRSNKTMKIVSDRYVHKLNFLSDHEIFFDRQKYYNPDYSHVDTYGSFWSFIFADMPENAVTISLGENSIRVEGKMGLLVPPHAVVTWSVRCGNLNWFCYSNKRPYPESFPKKMTVYPLLEIPETISPQWIQDLILNSKEVKTLDNPGVNAYAKKLKQALDTDFKLNKSLQEYSQQIGLSKEWLIRYFKKSYGVSPIAYRNKKRLFEAMFLLQVEKDKIIDLSHNMGFNDLKHFNQLFKKTMAMAPSKFVSK